MGGKKKDHVAFLELVLLLNSFWCFFLLLCWSSSLLVGDCRWSLVVLDSFPDPTRSLQDLGSTNFQQASDGFQNNIFLCDKMNGFFVVCQVIATKQTTENKLHDGGII